VVYGWKPLVAQVLRGRFLKIYKNFTVDQIFGMFGSFFHARPLPPSLLAFFRLRQQQAVTPLINHSSSYTLLAIALSPGALYT